ncbi:unnamed protein product [Rodentolepis nana]|uniref:Anosmin-1 n=1 Tax=Rodentolepis nana TaxID=102285 RepID=A0A0R3SZW9_RODNA|nr:unnamed protein product [Rodentolepis nana]
MITSKGTIIFLITVYGILNSGYADITDMIGEAICAAQCLANFTMSLAEPERTFLNQHPDLSEPHCLSKRSNCSLCLDVCRWPRQNISTCISSCDQLKDSELQLLPSSSFEVHRQTCREACTFSAINRQEREKVVSGLAVGSCPLTASWPEADTCSPHQTCTTDADCGLNRLAKCCLFDACQVDSSPTPPAPQYRLARGRESHAYQASPVIGHCMRINNDTAFGYGEIPPVPDRPSVRQTALTPGEQEVYQLELDWPDYYNTSQSYENPGWTYPAVFLVQVRLFREVGGSLFTDHDDFGDEILQDELFSEWRSLVWVIFLLKFLLASAITFCTTKVGAVLSDLSPGTWYQFRLKAASVAGFGGNGRPSPPVKVMTLPEAPLNLTESNSRVYSNKVEIKLQWEPPTYGNVPIKFYRVSWKKNVPPHMEDSSLSEFEAKVPKKVLSYTLQDLESATVYKVQVTAVAVVDGKEWSSPPVTRFIKTPPIPSKEYPSGIVNYNYNTEGRTCRCGESPEFRNFIQPTFYENGVLKARLTIPRYFLTQYFGPSVKETTIFHLVWYPHVCIETQNSKVDISNAPSVINVYISALAGMELEGLRFQCHYKLQIRLADEPLQMTSKKTMDLCFCTPSCTDVVIKSGPRPRNCSFAEVLIPHRPVDVGYRLFPTEVNQRHPIVSGGSTASSQSEMEPVFPVQNSFKLNSGQPLGFDAIIFWKPHPEMVISSPSGNARGNGNSGRYTKYADPSMDKSFPETRRQSRGYRVIWGPRLVEPIEPDMYSNGIAPQLDPERTESKVVDSKVHNVILRNLEPDTLYIVQVQTIGIHGDSPVNVVFFTTPSKYFSITIEIVKFASLYLLILFLDSIMTFINNY